MLECEEGTLKFISYGEGGGGGAEGDSGDTLMIQLDVRCNAHKKKEKNYYCLAPITCKSHTLGMK